MANIINDKVKQNKSYIIGITVIALAISSATVANLTNAGGSPNYEREAAKPHLMAATGLDGRSGDTAYQDTERKKATRITMELQVRDVKQSEQEIRQQVTDSNGYVSSSYINTKSTNTGDINVRIPTNRTSQFISSIEEIGKIQSKRENAEDVTDQYNEIETELESKKQELERLRSLMNQTDNVSDLIQIQERIGELNSRINYLEQRKTRLDSRIEYTEIDIELEQPTPLNTGFEPRQSLSQSYKGFFNTVSFIIISIGYLIPIVIIGIIAYSGLKLAKRLRKN